jgi:N-acetylmuramoyl-L-alanine amidase
MSYKSVAVSSGHGLKVRGAHGILDEVDEARRVANRLVEELRKRGVEAVVFHDDVSTGQSENLERITDWHNDQDRELDVSVHLNAFEQTEAPRGCEVLYVTQGSLAARLSSAIAEAGGFIDRGPKKRTDLYVLNNTEMPCVLLEVCFVDSEADAEQYEEYFDEICLALADELGGKLDEEVVPPEEVPPPTAVVPRIDIEVEGSVIITVNGVQVTQ